MGCPLLPCAAGVRAAVQDGPGSGAGRQEAAQRAARRDGRNSACGRVGSGWLQPQSAPPLLLCPVPVSWPGLYRQARHSARVWWHLASTGGLCSPRLQCKSKRGSAGAGEAGGGAAPTPAAVVAAVVAVASASGEAATAAASDGGSSGGSSSSSSSSSTPHPAAAAAHMQPVAGRLTAQFSLCRAGGHHPRRHTVAAQQAERAPALLPRLPPGLHRTRRRRQWRRRQACHVTRPLKGQLARSEAGCQPAAAGLRRRLLAALPSAQ